MSGRLIFTALVLLALVFTPVFGQSLQDNADYRKAKELQAKADQADRRQNQGVIVTLVELPHPVRHIPPDVAGDDVRTRGKQRLAAAGTRCTHPGAGLELRQGRTGAADQTLPRSG